jgi:S-DNA-T family DNA segregation ATPase FtsK/SpoIIIE
MERRYDLFAALGVRNIGAFNKRVAALAASRPPKPEPEPDEDGEGAAGGEGETDELETMPFIVIVLDELADLMMVAAREVETAIARLAQKARAAGIHLVVATQRPSTDVMSGTIRNNFPARISFRVASGTDSRTVLDTQGAESLLGAGDMLVRPPGTSDLLRVHGAYVSDEEVERVIQFLRSQGAPQYEEAVFSMTGEEEGDDAARTPEEDEKYGEKYDLAVELVARKRRASVSFIQRHLRVGYNTAARLMERMEQEGVVGPERGSRPREVLINPPPEP